MDAQSTSPQYFHLVNLLGYCIPCTLTVCYLLVGKIIYFSSSGPSSQGGAYGDDVMAVTALIFCLGIGVLFIMFQIVRLAIDKTRIPDDESGEGLKFIGISGEKHRSAAENSISSNSSRVAGSDNDSTDYVSELYDPGGATNRLSFFEKIFPLVLAIYLSLVLFMELYIGSCEELAEESSNRAVQKYYQWYCNPYDEVGGIPTDTVAALLLLPLSYLIIIYGAIRAEKPRLLETLTLWYVVAALISASFAVDLLRELLAPVVIYATVARALLRHVGYQRSQVRALEAQLFYLMTTEKDRKKNYATEMRHMIANVAHDLKTPLTSYMSGVDHISTILGDIELLAQANQLTPDICLEQVNSVKDCLESIRNTSSFMVMSINRCIDTTKISSGVALVPSMESVELRSLVLSPIHIMTEIQSRVRVAFRHHDLASRMCSHVFTDKQWLLENLLCLISNGVKYTRNQGRVDVRVSLLTARQLLHRYPPANNSMLEKLRQCTGSREQSQSITSGSMSSSLPSDISAAQQSEIVLQRQQQEGEEQEQIIEKDTPLSDAAILYGAILKAILPARFFQDNSDPLSARHKLNAVAPTDSTSVKVTQSITNNNSNRSNNSERNGSGREKTSRKGSVTRNMSAFKFDHLSRKMGSSSSSQGKHHRNNSTRSSAGGGLFDTMARRIEIRSTVSTDAAGGVGTRDAGANAAVMQASCAAALSMAIANSISGVQVDNSSSVSLSHGVHTNNSLVQGARSGNFSTSLGGLRDDEENSKIDSGSENNSSSYSYSARHVNSQQDVTGLSAGATAGGRGVTRATSQVTAEDEEDLPTMAAGGGPATTAGDITQALFVVFEVHDRGAGLTETVRASMFSPFKQAERLAGGAGLGLYSLAGRVDSLGGAYGVKAREDKHSGSVFWFALPYKPDLVSASHFAEQEQLKEQGKQQAASTVIPPPAQDATLPPSAATAPTSDAEHEHNQKVDRSTTPTNEAAAGLVQRIRDAAAAEAALTAASETVFHQATLPKKKAYTQASKVSDGSKSSTSTGLTDSAGETIPATPKDAIGVETTSPCAATSQAADVQQVGGLSTMPAAVPHASNTIKESTTTTTTAENVAPAVPTVPSKPNTTVNEAASATAAQPCTATNHAPVAVKTTTSNPPASGDDIGNLNILVVDDALSILKMMGMMLTRKGHSVDKAENGLDALEAIQDKYTHTDGTHTTPYDVVLMDLQMPVMDGLEAVRRLREGEASFEKSHPGQRKRQIVICMSANSDPTTRQDALDLGADAFIAKPVALAKFYTVYREVSGAARLKDTSARAVSPVSLQQKG